MWRIISILILVLFFRPSFSQTDIQYFGAAGEGFTSITPGGSADISYRKFSAPMFPELCEDSDESIYFTSPTPVISLAQGDTFSLADLRIDAIGNNEEFIGTVPVTIGLPEIENEFLTYQPYDLTLTAQHPGMIQIEITGYCDPTSRTYLTLKVDDTNTVSTRDFSITVPGEWEYRIEEDNSQGELLIIYQPGSAGEMKLKSMVIPGPMSQQRLRTMTNVPDSEVLSWEAWGDYSGYHYSYIENGKLYNQWWLTNQNKLVFITHEDNDASDSLIEIIRLMVSSISQN